MTRATNWHTVAWSNCHQTVALLPRCALSPLLCCGVVVPRSLWFRDVAALLALAVASTSVSCSLLLDEGGVQCRGESDCARFPNATCNVTTSLCVPRPDTSLVSGDAAPSVDAGQPVDAPVPPMDGRAMETGVVTRVDGVPDGFVNAFCPDFDHDGIPDCKESLIVNGDFRVDLVGWVPELNVTQAFFPTNDGTGFSTSGSIAVLNTSQSDVTGSTISGSWQCVRTMGGTGYNYYAQTLVTADAASGVLAGIAFQFFASPDCSGSISGVLPAVFGDANVSGWRMIQGIATSPPGVLSMQVRLVVLKPFKLPPTQALFDNILLRAR